MEKVMDFNKRILSVILCVFLCVSMLVVRKPLNTKAEAISGTLVSIIISLALSAFGYTLSDEGFKQSMTELLSPVTDNPRFWENFGNDLLIEQIMMGIGYVKYSEIDFSQYEYGGISGNLYYMNEDGIFSMSTDELIMTTEQIKIVENGGEVPEVELEQIEVQYPVEVWSEIYQAVIKHYSNDYDFSICKQTFSPSKYPTLEDVCKKLESSGSKKYFCKTKANFRNSTTNLSFQSTEKKNFKFSMKIVNEVSTSNGKTEFITNHSPLSFYFNDENGETHYLTLNFLMDDLGDIDVFDGFYYLYYPIIYGNQYRFILRTKAESQSTSRYFYSDDSSVYLDGTQIIYKDGYITKKGGNRICAAKSMSHWLYSTLAQASSNRPVDFMGMNGTESEGTWTDLYSGYNDTGVKTGTGTDSTENTGKVTVKAPGNTDSVTKPGTKPSVGSGTGANVTTNVYNPADTVADSNASTITQSNAAVNNGSLTVDEVITAVPSSGNTSLDEWKAPNRILQKFPFCIPYDLYKLVTVFSGNSVAPIWTTKLTIMNKTYEITINPLEYGTDKYFKMFRYFILITYCLGLILVTRRIIKG